MSLNQPGGPCSIVEIEAQSLVILPAQTICLQVGFLFNLFQKPWIGWGYWGNNHEPQPGGPCSIVEIEAQSLVIPPAHMICLQVQFLFNFFQKALNLLGILRITMMRINLRPMLHC